MSVSVRPAAMKDRNGCLSLISILTGEKPQSGWEETYAQLIGGKRGAILVAEEDGIILGR